MELQPPITVVHPDLHKLIDRHAVVFEDLRGLPLEGDHDHAIQLISRSQPPNIRPYRYPYVQKNEIEKMVEEIAPSEFKSIKVMVLIGETGSGKSTQLVQFLADSGFALKGSLVCTQPRKVAAMSLAQRVAGECRGCYKGTCSVSCCTTYIVQQGSLAKITYMTDHRLLQLCMSDSELAHISCIIVDEAHERSLSTDLLLALLKKCLLKRPELRLIIMSATADAKTLSDFFCGCMIFHVPGRNFPVDIIYVPNEDAEVSESSNMKYGRLSVPSYVTQVIRIVADIHAKEEEGAILTFLTSQIEVEWARDQFQEPSVMVLALHGKLSIEEQNSVFENAPLGKRKVIFATNIAETSLTIPGVKFVVDSGMVKESRFDPKTGINVLRVCRISQSAAAQRSGRAGRTRPGVCYRLYTEEEFNVMAPYRDPEILRVHVGIAILKLLALGIQDLKSFDFVQAPSQDAIDIAGLGREGLVLAAVMANAVIEQDWVSAIQPLPPYDILLLKKLAMEKKIVTGLGKCLLKRFSGKANYNLHSLVDHIQQRCNSHRFGIEIDHDKQEIQLFGVMEKMGQAYGLLEDVLKCERRWMYNDCMEKSLFYATRGKHSPVALFGAGAEIKHLELEDKYLSVEVCHPNAQILDDREVLLLFENCAGGIAGFQKHPGAGKEGIGTGKWGILTFFSPEAAQTAVCHANNLRVGGSCLTVCPFNASPVMDHKRPGFPAVKAMVTWPRRQSKGMAVIRCEHVDVDRIALSCSGIVIGRSFVRCRRGKTDGSVFMTGLDTDVTESQILQTLRYVTDRQILEVFLIRQAAGLQPSSADCETALSHELAKFVPQDKCQVIVYNSDPKDFNTRALVTFDGSIHLRAAMALSHLQGKVLSVCMTWQKINCEQTFYSTILCSAPIYSVLKMELQSLIESFQKQNAGLKLILTKTEYGSYKLKILSNTMEAVVKCRSSLEELLKGTVVGDDRLNPAAIQLLFTREGLQLLRSLEQKTKTYILFEKRTLTIKIFGPADKNEKAATHLIDGLILLHENKHHEIPLRGEGVPHGLMKEIVKRFDVASNWTSQIDWNSLSRTYPGD
ncbi:hypothetical protein KI387_009111, partial [Taxus chinensis]